MRRNTRWTHTRFHLVRLLGKAELAWWGCVAWLADQRDQRRDKRIAEGLAADPQRYGRRPYERSADVLSEPEW